MNSLSHDVYDDDILKCESEKSEVLKILKDYLLFSMKAG